MTPQKVADRFVQDSADTNAAVTLVDYAVASLTVGHVLIIRCAVDNAGGGGAALALTVTNQSGTPIDTATDVVVTQNNDPGAASAGVTNNVIYARITATSGTVRVAHSSARHAGVAEEWKGISVVAGAVVVVGTPVGANGVASTNLASVADASVASGNLAYGTEAIEGPSTDTITEDADTTNGAWVSLTKAGLTNGTADINVTVTGAYKVVSAAGGQTYNPTINNARDSAGLIIEFANGDQTVGMNSNSFAAVVNSPGVANRQIVGMLCLETYAGGALTLARTSRLSAASASSFGTGAHTTGAFTPSNNSLLVVSCSYAADVSPSQPITIDDSAGLTWTSHPQQGNDNGVSCNRVAQFTAPVGTGVSMTLELDAGSVDVYRWQVSAVDYTGYSTAAPTDATAAGSPPDGNPPASGLTLSSAPLSDSYVVAAVDCNTSSGLNVAPGAGWTEITEVGGDFDVLSVQERTGSTSTSVVWATLDAVADVENSAVAVEVQAGTTATAVVNPPGVTQGGPVVTLGSNDFSAAVNNPTVTQTAGSQTVGMNSLNAAATVNNPTVRHWQPDDLAGLKYWFDPGSGTSTTTDGATTIGWTSRAGSDGVQLLQLTSTKRMTYESNEVNGLPVIRADGVDDLMECDTVTDTTITVFLVVRRRSGGSTIRAALTLDPDDTQSVNAAVYNTAADAEWQYSNPQTGFDGSDPDRWSVLVLAYVSASALGLYADGYAQLPSSINPHDDYQSGGSMRLRIGAGTDTTNFYSGDYGDIVAYDSALAASNRQKVERFLLQKYSQFSIVGMRGQQDDGDEDGATTIGVPYTTEPGIGANELWAAQDAWHPFRVRFAVRAGPSAITFTPKIQYRHTLTSPTEWRDVGTGTETVRVYPSDHVTDGTATTQQMTTGTFVAGTVESTSATAAAISLGAGEYTEVEWCLVHTYDAQDEHVELRVVDDVNGGWLDPLAGVKNGVGIEGQVYQQEDYRGRNDDGDEDGATWKAALDTGWDQLPNETFRARIGFEVFHVHPSYRNQFRLQARLNAGSWFFVTAASTIVKSVTSTHFADEDPTTQQLNATPTFRAGFMDEDGVASEDFSHQWPEVSQITPNRTELEFALQIVDADVADGDTVQLRVTNFKEPFTSNAFGNYAQMPTITVAKTTAVLAGLDASATVNNPTVTTLTAVALGSLDAAAVVNGPAVTPGAVTVVLNSLDASAAVNQPAVATLTTVATNSLDAGATVNAPAVVQVVALISLSAAAVVNNPTITQAQIVGMNALDASATVNGPAIVEIAAIGTLDASATVNNPTVTPGSVTIALNSLDAAAIANNPTVAPGTVTVVAQALDVSATVNGPAVAAGSVTVSLNSLDAGATVNSPAILAGSVTITLNALDASAVVNAPAVIQVVSLGSLDAAATVNAPAVVQAVALVVLDASATVNSPSVATGSVTVAMNSLDASAVVNDPTVTPAGAGITMAPADFSATVNQPSVVPGVVTVFALSLDASATVNDPTVAAAAVAVATQVLDASAVVNAPAVTPGAVTIALQSLDASATPGAPTITTSTTVALAGLNASATVNAPSVATGAVTVALQLLNAAATVNNPYVSMPGVGGTIEVKVGGVFVTKPLYVMVGGVWQPATMTPV